MVYKYSFTVIFIIFFSFSSFAQLPDENGNAPYIFLDCNARNCDFNHFRQEILWVNWVRDREDSDVHLLITSDRTGGGGLRYSLDFIGRRDREGQEKILQFTTDANATDSEVREELENRIALGLIEYVQEYPDIASRLTLNYQVPGADEPVKTALNEQAFDPWKLWVFRLGADGRLDGESNESSYNIEGYMRADRVSDDMKINFGVRGDYKKTEFEDIEEGETFTNVSEDYSANLSMVWSLDPQWSVGGGFNINRSTFLNRDLAIFTGPAIEYNFYPYSESNRRAITMRYNVELASYNYELETVLGKTEEVIARHSFRIGAAIQQPWGEIFGSVEGIQYFHDLSTHRINTFLRLEYRLFKGFSIDIFSFFSRIKDQFYLSSEGLSPEEILTRRRQRETAYRFNLGMGFNYRFGSKYANTVNVRMSGGRRF